MSASTGRAGEHAAKALDDLLAGQHVAAAPRSEWLDPRDGTPLGVIVAGFMAMASRPEPQADHAARSKRPAPQPRFAVRGGSLRSTNGPPVWFQPDLTRRAARHEDAISEHSAYRQRRLVEMAEGLILEFDGIGRAEYNAVNGHLGIDPDTGEGDWPAGLLFHAGGAKASGWVVFELWESRQAQEKFMNERLGRALQEGGINGPPARLEWLESAAYHSPGN